jgi:GNAT superfamily N-acetyltransferase
MLIRPMEEADIPAAARLFRELALEFIVHDSSVEDASTFVRENDEEGIRGYVARGHVYHVAVEDGELVGFIAVRDGSHLFHLFVAKRWHGRGVARRLWDVAREAALAAGNQGAFTVNSSRYAQPVYASFGFVPTAPMQCVRGLRFVPMQLTLQDTRSALSEPLQAGAATGC